MGEQEAPKVVEVTKEGVASLLMDFMGGTNETRDQAVKTFRSMTADKEKLLATLGELAEAGEHPAVQQAARLFRLRLERGQTIEDIADFLNSLPAM
eukprot:NODE_6534_length_448_cov_138.210526_g4978_i0.p2 GENE.NODE_6534_length_448_cov_138.210526_g4978_i0~~NODE_6534_length_448_cov_138.210526_g4978_i0.p2  ORF type:complete len:96 (+),score=35.90 NODE_6534_length_448_cov_138.210526_g4978_i0:36-323(+)